jgi:hypothetical protein
MTFIHDTTLIASNIAISIATVVVLVIVIGNKNILQWNIIFSLFLARRKDG